MKPSMWTKNETILVTGTVSEIHPNLKYWVELPNGHVVHGHVARKLRDVLGGLAVGERVQLEISPFDLGRGRILSREG